MTRSALQRLEYRKISMLAARVLEGFREPADALAELFAPAREPQLRPGRGDHAGKRPR